MTTAAQILDLRLRNLELEALAENVCTDPGCRCVQHRSSSVEALPLHGISAEWFGPKWRTRRLVACLLPAGSLITHEELLRRWAVTDSRVPIAADRGAIRVGVQRARRVLAKHGWRVRTLIGSGYVLERVPE